MADLWPEPVPGAPYTSSSMAALVLGAASRRVADYARSMVPTGPRTVPYEGSMLAGALQLAVLVQHVVEAAVVLEREDGTCWQEIADTSAAQTHPSVAPRSGAGEDGTGGEAGGREQERRWAAVLQRWQSDLELAALPGCVGAGDLLDVLADPPEQVARELDEWVLRHHERGVDPDVTAAPVSDGLERMDPGRELMHLAALRRRLEVVGAHPWADQLGPILAREALVDAALDSSAPPS